MQPEIFVALASDTDRERLSLVIDGRSVVLTFRVDALARRLVEEIPPVLLDLLEIAATVYAADLSISRGGPTDAQLGGRWRRGFHCQVPVRCRKTWATPEVSQALTETVGFLSDDTWRFSFEDREDPGPRQGLFRFGQDAGFAPDRVAMFSGGLDSLAGAAEALIAGQEKTVLVSHGSATKLAAVQKSLVAALEAAVGPGRVQHISLLAHLSGSKAKERTQRSRSFLYAALGLVVAQVHGRDRVTFYENGVVSLNLPPVGNVIGARATRTTHPKVLAGFAQLFSALLERPIDVLNPFLWSTKADVVQRVEDLGLGAQIAQSHSCADTHNRTRQYTHCGRCSQCIDRRFAVLSLGLDARDPGMAYQVDLMDGPRNTVRDREMVLSYVRNARFFRAATRSQFLHRFPEVTDALGHLDTAPGPALERLHHLYQRFGASVTAVMETALAKPSVDPDSLRALYRETEAGVLIMETPVGTATPLETPARVTLHLDDAKGTASITELPELGRAAARLFGFLARCHLASLGKGLDPYDFQTVTGTALMQDLGYESEDTVRRAVQRARGRVASLAFEAGLEIPDLIENVRGFGYRLRPDAVQVRVITPAEPAGRSPRRRSPHASARSGPSGAPPAPFRSSET